MPFPDSGGARVPGKQQCLLQKGARAANNARLSKHVSLQLRTDPSEDNEDRKIKTAMFDS